MPNPRAQKQVTLDRVTEDLKSFSQPLTAIADMMAGALRGSTAATLGAPGDIREIVDLVAPDTAQRVLGQRSFPTTEEMKAKLPPVVPQGGLPVRQHTAEIYGGLGEFMPLPGSGAVAAGLGRAVKAVPGALRHGAEEFAKASYAGSPRVIKPKGGNWLGGEKVAGNVENQLSRLKMADYTPSEKIAEDQKAIDTAKRIMGEDPTAQRAIAQMENELQVAKRNNAINDWVDRNLRNYVKKEMGTPEDPVRKLAEQGILHMEPYGDPYEVSSRLMKKRKDAGFNPLGEGKSEPARFWERQADIYIEGHPASVYKQGEMVLPSNPWLANVPDETMIYSGRGLNDLGFDHIVDVLRQDVREGRIRPEQLSKVSMEQAVRRTFEYDQEMAKKMAEAQIKATEGMPVYKEYPEGYKWIELTKPNTPLPEGYTLGGGNERFVFDPSGKDVPHPNIKALEDALKYEGETMGHCVGGYCPDVLEGRSRIFSLRDAKGEPHVTIEVEPQSRIGFREGEGPKTAEERFDLKTEWLKGVESGKIGDDVSFAQWWRSQHGIPEPERPLQISQIKGKQNRAPKEEYLPYVQDFVRGGQWSDVGDIANAGLRDMKGYEPLRKYLEGKGVKYERYIPESEFKQFEDDFLMDRLYPKDDPAYLPPTEGMKRGGKVSVSDNCDCQMMEVEDKKFGKGGLAKEGAEAVVKALTKQAAKEAVAKESAIKASEALGKIEGQHLGITQADRTKVGGKWLGGPGFSGLQLERPEYKAAEAVWGVKDPGTAKTILGSQTREGKPVVFTTMLGSPTQHQSNQMVFNELLRLFNKSAKEGNLDPDQYAKINERLRMAVDKDGKPVFPEDVDILSPNFKKIANTFDRRAIAGNIMGGVGVGGKKGQIFPYDKVIQHTTDPALVDAPAGSLGNRMFTLSGGVVQRPDLHPAFPTILQGEDLGVTFTPVMRDLVMKDFIEKTMKEKGRAPGYMDYTRGYPPTQLITEELLTNLQKQGYKKGGKVAKPMQKAEGGEIRAEDLSIEERPL